MTAKILYWDIECAPALVHSWGLRDLHLGLNQIIEDPYIIGIGYAWEGQRPKYLDLWEMGREAMFQKIWELLDEADVVVSYNGDNFDTPWVNGELMREGMTPPSPFKSVDLYKVFKKNARFISHKLDYIAGAILGQKKLPTGGHQLWVDCINGDPKARKRMATYCKRDVSLLEPLLEHARPWLSGAVNFALLNEVESGCQKCGSEDYQRRGYAYTESGAFPQICCNDCGGWSRLRKREYTTELTGSAR